MLHPGLRRAGGAGLVRHLNAAQAANGFTLTVWRAYADANLIAIGYTLTAADTRAHPQLSHELHGPGAVALTDRAGQQYQALSTTANIGGGCPIHPCTLPLAGAVALYDAAPLSPDATQASLRLTVPAVEVAPAVGQGTPTTVPGAWSVDFTLPVVPARRALVGQTVNAAGIPLTLEQVVATPLETRLCVRGLIPWERAKSLPQPVIAGAGWPPPPQPPARTSRRADGVVVYRVDPAPAEQRAVWVVTFRAD